MKISQTKTKVGTFQPLEENITLNRFYPIYFLICSRNSTLEIYPAMIKIQHADLAVRLSKAPFL
jgi:hypothetical protein